MYEFLLAIQYMSILFFLLEAGYIFFRMKTRLHEYLFVNCVATLINNMGYLMEMLSRTEEESLMAIQMAYLGKVWVPFSLFIFVLELCKVKMNKKVIAALAGVHTVTFLLVLTCKWHPLYYSSMTYVEEGIFPYIKSGHGIWYNMYTGLLLFYIIYGLGKLGKTIMREKHHVARIRLLYVFLAIVAESLCFTINLTGITANYDMRLELSLCILRYLNMVCWICCRLQRIMLLMRFQKQLWQSTTMTIWNI